MRRREFIRLLGCATAAWPHAARAQREALPVIGYLSARSADDTLELVAAFRRGLGEFAYVEGQTISIEYRWADGEHDRLPLLAAELARRPVRLLVATGGESSAVAAKAATTTLPIVFATGGDPIKAGLVASYNRPGGNATGIDILSSRMEPKRLGLLHEVLPRVATIGFLLDPDYPPSRSQLADVEEAARSLRLQIRALPASTDREIDVAFEIIAKEHVGGLLVAAGAFFDTRRDKLIALSASQAVPTMYHFRSFAEAGGFMSYGIDISDVYHQVGAYAGQILRGAQPAELPVLQPTKFELVINLKTAKTFAIDIPPTLLARADEVIE